MSRAIADTETLRQRINSAENGDIIDIATTRQDWSAPVVVVEAGPNPKLYGPLGAQYYADTEDDKLLLRTADARKWRGEILQFDVIGHTDVDRTVPDIDSVWSEIKSRHGITKYCDLEDVLEAAEDASSLLDVCRGARIPRRAANRACSALGLSVGQSQARTFPPDDLDRRVELIRDGDLPRDARARDWDWDDVEVGE